MKKYIRNRSILSGLLIFGAIVVPYAVLRHLDRDRPFDAGQWLEASGKSHPCVRYQMASSLVSILRSNKTMGVTDVVHLLGRPDESNIQNAEINSVQAGGYMVYKLGGNSRVLPTGRYDLIITFDCNGVVNRADIVPE